MLALHVLGKSGTVLIFFQTRVTGREAGTQHEDGSPSGFVGGALVGLADRLAPFALLVEPIMPEPGTIDPMSLSEAEAASALQRHGFDDLNSSKSRNIISAVCYVVREPRFLLLLACGTFESAAWGWAGSRYAVGLRFRCASYRRQYPP